MDLLAAIEELRQLVEAMTGKTIERVPRPDKPGMSRRDTRGLFKRNIRQAVFVRRNKGDLLKRHERRQASRSS